LPSSSIAMWTRFWRRGRNWLSPRELVRIPSSSDVVEAAAYFPDALSHL
jgi:hypothetical protein